MASRLSGQASVFGLVFFVSLVGCSILHEIFEFGVAIFCDNLILIIFCLFLSSLLSFPATKTPRMVFRHSEKLITSDLQEKCNT